MTTEETTLQLETEGLHPATGICLAGLQWLHERRSFANVLDMGCGGGILSLVCATIWDAKVMAADIAEKAIEDTKALIAEEKLESLVTAVRSDGFLAPEIAANGPYDLIIINLLAEPIVQWAQDVAKNLAPGGVAVLGGILEWQAPLVIRAYLGLGFEIQHEIGATPWKLLVLAAPPQNP